MKIVAKVYKKYNFSYIRLELLQETDVVFVHESHVCDFILEEGDSLKSDSEGEA